jgi:hypothetical protein
MNKMGFPMSFMTDPVSGGNHDDHHIGISFKLNRAGHTISLILQALMIPSISFPANLIPVMLLHPPASIRPCLYTLEE